MQSSTMDLFKKSLKNIYIHKYSYLTTAVFLQLFMIFIGSSILSFIFKLILQVTGEDNITKENIVSILLNPISFVLIVVFLLFMAFLIFVEFSIMTLNVYGNTVGKKFTLKTTLINVYKDIKSLIGFQIIFFILYFIALTPIVNLGLSSILTSDLYIPKFIVGEILKTNKGIILYSLSLIVLIYFNLRLFFVIPLMMTNDDSLLKNIKRSWEISKNSKKQLIFSLLLFGIILISLSLVIVFILILGAMYIDPSGENLAFQAIFLTIVKIIVFSVIVLSKIAIMTNLILIIIEKEEIDDKLLIHIEGENLKKKTYKKLTFSLVFLVILSYIFYNSTLLTNANLNNNIQIVAHRGYTKNSVENSLEALRDAAKHKAKYVEVDILLTKDNKFVVMHDYNLNRLAKIDKKVEDMNYDEVVGLDILQNDNNSKIPSFEEFVAEAKKLGVKLFVELKPHGKEPENYASIVIDKLKELKIDTEYKVISLDLKVLEQINTLEKNIDTGYIIPLQFGKFANNNVDFFVIEDFSFKQNFVNEALAQNKEIYVWTINDELEIEKYLQSNITGIITDELELVESKKSELENNNTYFDKVLRIIFSL